MDILAEHSVSTEDNNWRVFNSPTVVDFYANYVVLQPAEMYVFTKYVPQGASILDIGVGCGRTTPYLASKASRYVGVDYAKGMIDVCVTRFPQNTFYCADAANLSRFEDSSFELVVFSFNGIDCLPSREQRLQCFAGIFRVLAPGGLFIFSSHNSKMLFSLPRLDNARPIQMVRRIIGAAFKTVPFGLQLLRSGSFRVGAGYYFDQTHGTKMYCSTPELTGLDVRAAGFNLLEVVHNHHPRRVPRHLIPYFYYVVSKPTN